MQDFLGLPLDASAHGPEIDAMIAVIHWLMLVLFVGWGAFFGYTLVRFRKSRNVNADYAGVKSHLSSYLEIGIAIFEIVLIIGFAIPLWAKRVNEFPSEKDALVVHVIAEQFAWNVHYSGPDGIFGKTERNLVTPENPTGLDRSDPAGKDDITTINQLTLPVNKPVIIRLTTKDVIHSFGIPLLRVKQDVIPGQDIPVWFKAIETTENIKTRLTKPYPIAGGQYAPVLTHMVAMQDYVGKDSTIILGKGMPVTAEVIQQLVDVDVAMIQAGPDTPMEIACAQLCGLGHYRMRGYVSIKTQEEYEAWLKEEASYLVQE